MVSRSAFLLLIFFLSIVIFGLWSFSYFSTGPERAGLPAQLSDSGIVVPYEDHFLLYVGNEYFFVTLAANAADRRKGLSGTPSLREREGKLFVFPRSDTYGFWMKDMNYPIDIIWFDADGYVVHIESNVSPETYPQTLSPKSEARYVLEIAAGKSAEYGIDIGTPLKFSGGITTCLRTGCYNK